MSHHLSILPSIKTKRAKRLGRGLGSGSGAKSGRGTTRHQTARGDMPIHFEGGQNRLVKKFPLLRGKLRNKSIMRSKHVISLDQLQQLKPDTVVTLSLVKENALFHYPAKQMVAVKVVGTGTLNIPLTVELPVTRSAKAAIVKAGGTVK
jgi:large subunit ribosomal protein L15